MSDLPTEIESKLIQTSFEQIDFGDVEIVDKLRDVRLDREEGGQRHFVGSCFGQAPEDESSFIVSFHCIVSKESTISSAYAYDTRTGNEIAAA